MDVDGLYGRRCVTALACELEDHHASFGVSVAQAQGLSLCFKALPGGIVSGCMAVNAASYQISKSTDQADSGARGSYGRR